MASTFSTDLKIELMATGENSGTWGTKTNTNLDLVQQAIVGYELITITANTTLVMTDATISNARNAVLDLSGTITVNSTVNVPNMEKTYIVKNSTSGAFTVTLRGASQTSNFVTFSTTDKTIKLVYMDGINVIDAGIDTLTNPVTLTNKTLTSPTINTATISLGASMDTNGFNIGFDNNTGIDDDSGNEQIKFSKTASAVNEITLANAATGNNPNFTASGGDTNVGINLTPKGTGAVTFNGTGKIQQVKEKVSVFATATTGTINYNFLDQAVLFHTTTATGQFTLNLRGSSSTTLNDVISTGESMTGAFLNTNSTFFVSTITVDGLSTNVTLEFQGGSAPTSGNAGIDTYGFTVIKTAASTFTILASQTQFN